MKYKCNECTCDCILWTADKAAEPLRCPYDDEYVAQWEVADV